MPLVGVPINLLTIGELVIPLNHEPPILKVFFLRSEFELCSEFKKFSLKSVDDCSFENF